MYGPKRALIVVHGIAPRRHTELSTRAVTDQIKKWCQLREHLIAAGPTQSTSTLHFSSPCFSNPSSLRPSSSPTIKASLRRPPSPMPPAPHLLLASGACSRRAGALSTLPSHSLAAYASANNVVLLDARSHKVHVVLPLHASVVTAVSLMALCDGGALLLAAAADGAVAAVTIMSDDLGEPSNWQAHDGQPCVALAACEIPGLAMVTAGMEGGLRLWSCEDDTGKWAQVAEAHVAPPGEVLLECVAMRTVSADAAIVSAGGTDRRVWLFSTTLEDRPSLEKVAVLDGHRDWVRGLAFSATRMDGSFRIASASKDGTARVWRADRERENGHDDFDVHTARVEAMLASEDWSFTAEALLDEHTAAVHSVEFLAAGGDDDMPQLLTSSMDCSVALWKLEDERWQCAARFGLMGGSAAHALGFFGASFASEEGDEMLGHNFAGALHCWRASRTEEGGVEFLAKAAPGGHFAAVTDLAWEPRGRYLLTCSADKTVRIFAEVVEEGGRRFVEWARPQVHGHAMFAVVFCDQEGRKYVSGAEERMLRMFNAPSSFRLPGETDLMTNGARKATAAVVPELGLSNKATFDTDEGATTMDEKGEEGISITTIGEELLVSSFGAARAMSIVPLEEDLKQKRLWPETAKLYGHGNEISCVTADTKNAVLASACRAQAAKDAAIILWDTNNGVECGRLSAHDLTINQMRFSGDGSALVSVSRDRSIAIFRKSTTENRFSFELAFHKKTAHTRLIYSCTWLLDDAFVATGGRDKCLKVFAIGLTGQGSGISEVFKQKFNSGVSALDAVAVTEQEKRAIIAAGFETGDIRLFDAQPDESGNIAITPLYSTSAHTRCGARVNRLQWRPQSCKHEGGLTRLQLGIAGDDLSVRVLDFELDLDTAR